MHEAYDHSIERFERLTVVKKPDCALVSIRSGLSLLTLFNIVLPLHVITLEEKTADDLEKHYFVFVLRVLSQEALIAPQLED